ncbi:hypothetical protein LTR85_011940 [Meristemomyces frigidus]|nr:hypothetical protein LTR85_011940 [Meristemomyces frigidus]
MPTALSTITIRLKIAAEAKKILDLPDELLVQVAERLPALQDLLSLRLACRRLSGPALDAQLKRIQAIYVDLSPSSLRRFSELCHSTPHAASIRELIYIPALHKLSNEQLESNKYFSAVVTRHKWPRQLIAEALELYAQVKDAQRELIAGGEVETTLASCLPLLPRLRKLSIRAVPLVSSGRDSPEADTDIYNKHRSWRDDGAESTTAKSRGPMLEQSAADELFFTMQYKAHVKSFQNPIQLLHALRSLHRGMMHRLRLRYIRRHFEEPRNTLPASAFSFSDAVLDTWDYVPTPASRIALWSELLGTMCNVTKLMMWEGGVDPVAFIKAVLQDVTFPKLETLEIEDHTTWVTLPLMRSRKYPHNYSSQTLAAFINKHALTLKHMNLSQATGVDEDTLMPSGEALRALLASVKISLTGLVTARVEEYLFPTKPKESGQRTPGGQHHDFSVRDDQRAEALTSDIGILARECEVVVREHAGELNGLFFEYDFGPYLLRKDGGS